MYIASHGRTGKASALSIASFGRLFRTGVVIIIMKAYREIMRLSSEIGRVMSLRSEID